MSMYIYLLPDGSTTVGYDYSGWKEGRKGMSAEELEDWSHERLDSRKCAVGPTAMLNKAGLSVKHDGGKLSITPIIYRHSSIYASSRLEWGMDWEDRTELAADRIVSRYCRENKLDGLTIMAMTPPEFGPAPKIGDTPALAELCLYLAEHGLIKEPDPTSEARGVSYGDFDWRWATTRVKLI